MWIRRVYRWDWVDWISCALVVLAFVAAAWSMSLSFQRAQAQGPKGVGPGEACPVGEVCVVVPEWHAYCSADRNEIARVLTRLERLHPIDADTAKVGSQGATLCLFFRASGSDGDVVSERPLP